MGAPPDGERYGGRPVEGEEGGGLLLPLDLPGRLADGAGRGWGEGGAGQRRSSSVFSPRSKRMPTAARSPGGISSPMSWTAWTMWVMVRVPLMMRVAIKPKSGGERGVTTGATGGARG